ncbi:hypothetical protein SLS60_004688 [Paraconiothyrium brasiliense]|uniref:AMP-activated protein kinase glycogen-binding domain-containing protein n=1 Tax=Paraconiothyrium brasiliense TaxID=300254 RepID=A0ABR3RL45_9PLEO
MEPTEPNTSKMPSGSRLSGNGNPHDVSSASTDDIIPQNRPAAVNDASASSEQRAEPSDSDPRPFSPSEVSLPSILLSPSVNGDAEFTGRATISILLLDARPPVLVWTSLNSWQAPFEMVAGDTDSTGRQIYTCQLDHVPEKPYQYKVRVNDRWILDDDVPIGESFTPSSMWTFGCE